jgi:hypothetical protein
MYHNVVVLQGIFHRQLRCGSLTGFRNIVLYLPAYVRRVIMAVLPLIVDINFPIESVLAQELRRRIAQIVCEPPATLFFVQVRITSVAKTTVAGVVGNIYRVTLCGLGGVPLKEEREFLLFKKEPNGSFQLQYIA